jgi:predicted metalloprotease with PDZ domain
MNVNFNKFDHYISVPNMKYIISYENPHHQYIDIEFVAGNINSNELSVQLPAWRPGRYELGNFAKNIQKWAAFDENGNPLKYIKTSKDCWKVETKGIKELRIKYNYYASELNAGSTYLDDKQLYMNPVNCCLYLPDRIAEECTIELNIPKDYEVATGMKKEKGKAKVEGERKTEIFHTKDYHELADSPFIASNSLQRNMFVLDGVEFYIWFQGECKPAWSKVINDFFIFINEQMLMMKEFPVETYHFLFQILPYRFYHGVEHLTSTVIALGPSYNLMKGDLYEDFLGISSHELFHAWNIKTIRPVEMMPYDYTKENYSKLGYVCEGVTTYYGDFLLFRSGGYSEEEYFKTFNERLQKHFDNFGRFNLSVADSSFDSWLDGYVQGIPNRKTSIYDEGCLLAFMADILIRKYSENKNSLDDVMRYLYFEFGKHNKGYSEQDYKKALELTAGNSFDDFFKKYVWGTEYYEELLSETLKYIGCEFQGTPSKKYQESYLGFKIQEQPAPCKVIAVYPGSVADKAGLKQNDEIIAVNNIFVKEGFTEWFEYWMNKKADITVSRVGTLKTISITPTKEVFYKTWSIKKLDNASEAQKQNFNSWSKRSFTPVDKN